MLEAKVVSMAAARTPVPTHQHSCVVTMTNAMRDSAAMRREAASLGRLVLKTLTAHPVNGVRRTCVADPVHCAPHAAISANVDLTKSVDSQTPVSIIRVGRSAPWKAPLENALRDWYVTQQGTVYPLNAAPPWAALRMPTARKVYSVLSAEVKRVFASTIVASTATATMEARVTQ